MSQVAWQYVVDKFRSHGGVLSTLDFISDIHTAAEYRRLIKKDLPRHGFLVISEKVTPRHWQYRLMDVEPSGQLRCA